jgi:hypothetical protein
MKRTLLLLLAAQLLLAPECASTRATTALASAASASPDGLVQLNDSNFELLARSGDAIHVFVLFTTSDALLNCVLCRPFEEQISALARREWPREAKKRLYFATANLADSPTVFKRFGVQSVPELAYFGPTLSNALVTHAGVVGLARLGFSQLELVSVIGFVIPRTRALQLDAAGAARFVAEKTGFIPVESRGLTGTGGFAQQTFFSCVLGAIGFAAFCSHTLIWRAVLWLRTSKASWLTACAVSCPAFRVCGSPV